MQPGCSRSVLPRSSRKPTGRLRASTHFPYSTGFLVTGNYVVGGVDVQGQSANGFSTGTIHISGVPANADILAAYLYWETIDLPGSANLNPLTTPVTFRRSARHRCECRES